MTSTALRFALHRTAGFRLAVALIALGLAGSLSACSSCGGGSDADETSDETTEGSADEAPADGSADGADEGSAEAADDGPSREALASAVALVNGEPVMSSDELAAELDAIVERYERLPDREPTLPSWRNERRRRIVMAAVHDHLVERYVAENAPEITDEEVEEFVRRDIGHVFDDERLFERFLASRGVSREVYMDGRRAELAEERVLAARGELEPTEEEITQFYERNRERWREQERARVRTITIRLRRNADDEAVAEARQRLAALRARVVDGGEDFAEVAQSDSESADRSRGGEMGWIVRGRRSELVESGVEDVIFNASPGDVTEIVRTPLGVQIFLVEDIRPAGIRDLDEVRDIIFEPLRRRKADRLRLELVNELQLESEIQWVEDRWGLELEDEAVDPE